MRSWKTWPVPYLVSLRQKESQEHNMVIITIVSYDEEARICYEYIWWLLHPHFFNTLGAMRNWQSNSDEVRNQNLKEIIWSPNFLNSKIGCGSYKWYDIFHDCSFPTSQPYNPYKEVFRELKSGEKKFSL